MSHQQTHTNPTMRWTVTLLTKVHDVCRKFNSLRHVTANRTLASSLQGPISYAHVPFIVPTYTQKDERGGGTKHHHRSTSNSHAAVQIHTHQLHYFFMFDSVSTPLQVTRRPTYVVLCPALSSFFARRHPPVVAGLHSSVSPSDDARVASAPTREMCPLCSDHGCVCCLLRENDICHPCNNYYRHQRGNPRPNNGGFRTTQQVELFRLLYLARLISDLDSMVPAWY